jgi:hypothetical protein
VQIGHRVLVREHLLRAVGADDQVVFLRLLGDSSIISAFRRRSGTRLPDARAEEPCAATLRSVPAFMSLSFSIDVGHDGLRVPPLAVLILRLDAERVEGVLFAASGASAC